jgi:hypothetical protein
MHFSGTILEGERVVASQSDAFAARIAPAKHVVLRKGGRVTWH